MCEKGGRSCRSTKACASSPLKSGQSLPLRCPHSVLFTDSINLAALFQRSLHLCKYACSVSFGKEVAKLATLSIVTSVLQCNGAALKFRALFMEETSCGDIVKVTPNPSA